MPVIEKRPDLRETKSEDSLGNPKRKKGGTYPFCKNRAGLRWAKEGGRSFERVRWEKENHTEDEGEMILDGTKNEGQREKVKRGARSGQEVQATGGPNCEKEEISRTDF